MRVTDEELESWINGDEPPILVWNLCRDLQDARAELIRLEKVKAAAIASLKRQPHHLVGSPPCRCNHEICALRVALFEDELTNHRT